MPSLRLRGHLTSLACARAALAALHIAGSAALVWHPSNPSNRMWDTWLYVQPDQPSPFYLNYLSSCDASCGGPTGGMWNGVGATFSTDGVHFADEGVVIHKDPKAVWLGSGSVLQASDGTYVMNFSEEYDCEGRNCQSIFFATSPDLVSWTRVPFAPPPANDSSVFKYGPGYTVGGRWDCIATVPKPGSPGEYYGYWTATPLGHGGAGVGVTTDLTGRHWKALPPITDGFPSAEVGSTVFVHDEASNTTRYFMLFHGGHLYTSTNPIAGYTADTVNAAFHADGDGVAFSRLWNVQDQAKGNNTVLLTHQWVVSGMIYLGPIKQAVVGTDGTLRAVYWPGNDKLKGMDATAPFAPPSVGGHTPVDLAPCAKHGADAGQQWVAPSKGGGAGRITPASNTSTCLSISTSNARSAPSAVPPPPAPGAAVFLGPCAASSAAAAFRLAANGSITSGGLCLDSTPGGTTMQPCTTSMFQQWSALEGGELAVTSRGTPLVPAALWTFDDGKDLGANTAVGAGAGDGLVCEGRGGCTQTTRGGRAALHLTAPSYLGHNSDEGVPSNVPLGNSAYTVSGWINSNPSGSVMEGLVGWGGFSKDYRSNAFATSGPSNFYNYWFAAGHGADEDMRFSTPGLGGGWGHVLCRWDPKARSRDCFWNGKLAKHDSPSVPHDTAPGHFRIGSTHEGEFLTGMVDDIAVFNTSLSDDQVEQAYVGDFAARRAGAPPAAYCLSAPAATPDATASLQLMNASLALNVGVVLEANMACAGAPNAGFVVSSTGAPTSGQAFLWDCATQTFSTAAVAEGHMGTPAVWDRGTKFPQTAGVALRLLVRTAASGDAMVEFYVNDVMGHPFTVKGGSAHRFDRVGVVGSTAKGRAAVDLASVKAWRMTLPAF